jgi:hypothetical protein
MEMRGFGFKEWLEKLCNIFQRLSRGNDEECKFFVNLFLINSE